jgi:hypothetical protein
MEPKFKHESIEWIWKVFKAGPGGILISGRVTGQACVIYHLNKWIGPPEWLEKEGYLITAFRSECLARKFSRFTNWEFRASADIILKGAAIGVGVPDRYRLKCDRSICYGELHIGTGLWPEGTVFCRRVYIPYPDLGMEPEFTNDESNST